VGSGGNGGFICFCCVFASGITKPPVAAENNPGGLAKRVVIPGDEGIMTIAQRGTLAPQRGEGQG